VFYLLAALVVASGMHYFFRAAGPGAEAH